jgi:hypothetical protein
MTREQTNGLKNIRTIIALAGCAFGLGLMIFGLGVGSSSKERVTSAVKEESTKKLPAWNIALGDLVILARDMGFDAKGVKETPIDQTKIAGKIESQLQSLRELYRQETSKNSALMGGVVLQLSVSPSGEVWKVREITSRISDNDFRKAVIAEASTWSFDQVVSEESTITCPLLFVREGMDITTLIRWEKNLSEAGDKSLVGKLNVNVESIPQIASGKSREASTREVAAPVPRPVPPPKAQAVAEGALYQLKYSTAIRNEPNYSAAAVARFAAGTKVILLGRSGDWYEVRYDGGPRGFLRKEFIAPVEATKRAS